MKNKFLKILVLLSIVSTINMSINRTSHASEFTDQYTNAIQKYTVEDIQAMSKEELLSVISEQEMALGRVTTALNESKKVVTNNGALYPIPNILRVLSGAAFTASLLASSGIVISFAAKEMDLVTRAAFLKIGASGAGLAVPTSIAYILFYYLSKPYQEVIYLSESELSELKDAVSVLKRQIQLMQTVVKSRDETTTK